MQTLVHFSQLHRNWWSPKQALNRTTSTTPSSKANRFLCHQHSNRQNVDKQAASSRKSHIKPSPNCRETTWVLRVYHSKRQTTQIRFIGWVRSIERRSSLRFTTWMPSTLINVWPRCRQAVKSKFSLRRQSYQNLTLRTKTHNRFLKVKRHQ